MHTLRWALSEKTEEVRTSVHLARYMKAVAVEEPSCCSRRTPCSASEAELEVHSIPRAAPAYKAFS